ncbi:hypothetical protein M2281_005653 [Mesorhizobium soli]|uniref:hypothetical protein n=1 Tax=Pseudaminobacter soli (ex Li et al. 2025) TaxID=1295366 RepID=UPI0024756E1F|nr:hypothetical protein [Mesorhizobium soli]MDH6235031.1 hypothetical protein [Mesorhizobium soli]
MRATQKLTWNIFDLRYRDGFDAVWVEVATGLTYDFDSYNAVYARQKLDTTSPPYNALSGDKINITRATSAAIAQHGQPCTLESFGLPAPQTAVRQRPS